MARASTAVTVPIQINVNPLPKGATGKALLPDIPMSTAQPQRYQEIAARVKQRLGAMEAYRMPWLNEYHLASEYVLRRKFWLSGYNYADDAAFVTTEVFDVTAPNSCRTMVSSLIGALWPNGSRSVRVTAPHSMPKEIRESAEVKDWYESCTATLTEKIDKREAGFRTALDEYMWDQGIFGTSGIAVIDNDDDDVPMHFQACDSKRTCISEGKDGYVDTVYIRRFVTVRQLVEKFDLWNVSERIRQLYQAPYGANLEEKVQYIEAIEPRRKDTLNTFGNVNMPIGSIYIETDTNHVLLESGYEEMPVFVCRFTKRLNEVYGRSPSIECMPDILEINSRREMLIVADEKMLNPPLALFDDGQLGGGTLDTSAGSVSIFHVTANVSRQQKVVEQIVTIGDLQWSYKRVTELVDIIEFGYYINQLTDFNNDTRMTLGEAKMRDQLRTQSLNEVYSRQLDELFHPLVSRSFNICFNRGLFGWPANSVPALRAQKMGQQVPLIPAAILQLQAQGKETHRFEFISPAARAMRAEELNGIEQTVTYVIGLQPISPDIVDNIDFDEVAHKVQDLTGAPPCIIRSAEDIQQLRKSRAAAQQKMQQIQTGKIMSETGRAVGQGMQAAAKAGVDPLSIAQALAVPNQQSAGAPQQ